MSEYFGLTSLYDVPHIMLHKYKWHSNIGNLNLIMHLKATVRISFCYPSQALHAFLRFLCFNRLIVTLYRFPLNNDYDSKEIH